MGCYATNAWSLTLLDRIRAAPSSSHGHEFPPNISRYFLFTCFTGTKVQILTQKAAVGKWGPGAKKALAVPPGPQFTCFTGTKVPILTPEELLQRWNLQYKSGTCSSRAHMQPGNSA